MGKIDFIIPWVDGSDPKWLELKRAYETNGLSDSTAADAVSNCRYRDNGLLKYWFRGIEKFAPWFNKVHFITFGQYPEWLVLDNPKLNVVNHSDYIPPEYLPTFNVNTIELNLHRIKSLSEEFVYFNDDIFLIKEIEPEYFFKDGCPVLESTLRYTNQIGYNNWSRLIFNDYCIVNKSFDISHSIWENRYKWFNIKELGYKPARKNFLCYFANRTLPVGLYGHIALPHLKSTIKEVWDNHPDVMHTSSLHKFRSDDQVNQWLFCAWNQAKGVFQPTRVYKKGIKFDIEQNTIARIVKIIQKQEYPQICLNESELFPSPEQYMEDIVSAFERILPEKSSFER